jgi:hypothetical protein
VKALLVVLLLQNSAETWTNMKFDQFQAKSITDQGWQIWLYSYKKTDLLILYLNLPTGHADLSLANPNTTSPANATALLTPSPTASTSGSNSDFNTRTTLSTRAIIGITIGGLVLASAVGVIVRRRYHTTPVEVVPVEVVPVRPTPQIVQTSYSVTSTHVRY